MEIRVLVDQRREAAKQFLLDHRDLLIRTGAVVSTWRRKGGRKLGPYFLLVVRGHDGHQMSIYLGCSGALVDEIRNDLATLQAPLREQRKIAAVRRQLRRELAVAKQGLDVELAKLGLNRKGHEIRGWSKLPVERKH